MKTENEVKKIEEILRVSNESNHKDDEILKMFSLWKALKIKCWIYSKVKENIKRKNTRTSYDG